MDEMGPLQPIPRGGRSWGKRVARRPDRYPRSGTIQWLAAFAPHTGKTIGKGYARKRTQEVQDFLEHVLLPAYPEDHIYMIWDNLSSHKTQEGWRQREDIKERITFVWLPTNSPWLNLIEAYFSVLSRVALQNTNFKTHMKITGTLEEATQYLNENPKNYR
jgi:transposase